MNTRVKGAFLIGVAVVAAALVVSQYLRPTATAPAAVVAERPTLTTDTPLKQYIPAPDSNNDGVPDWQELLTNSEPLVIDEPETFDEPETLTDQFALEFFERYVRNEGFGAFGENPEDIIGSASDELVAEAQDTLYTEKNISMYTASPEQIRTYGNQVAEIMFAYPLPEGARNEILVLEEAVAQNNADILTELDPNRRAYERMVEDMLALPVPRQLMKQHLDLTNSYQALASSLAAMQNTFGDPLMALLRLQRYQQDADGLAASINNLYNTAIELDANFQPTDRVFDVVEFIE